MKGFGRFEEPTARTSSKQSVKGRFSITSWKVRKKSIEEPSHIEPLRGISSEIEGARRCEPSRPLNYPAGTMSLAIDAKQAVLQRVALDVDLYANRQSGARNTSVPSLEKIKDNFGVAKQDYRIVLTGAYRFRLVISKPR